MLLDLDVSFPPVSHSNKILRSWLSKEMLMQPSSWYVVNSFENACTGMCGSCDDMIYINFFFRFASSSEGLSNGCFPS